MGLSQISLFSALADKMRWHSMRQSLLAENVANAETPGYKGNDLKPFETGGAMRGLAMAPVRGFSGGPGHIAIAGLPDGGGFTVRSLNNFEITPEGNGVTLEDEMMKVTSNQMDYQAVTALYARSVKIIKLALGRNA